jgi:hypothetical protein
MQIAKLLLDTCGFEGFWVYCYVFLFTLAELGEVVDVPHQVWQNSIVLARILCYH